MLLPFIYFFMCLGAKETNFWFEQDEWFNATPWFSALQNRSEYDVVACVHIVDEWFLLREFIIRNFLAGVQHFFVYDMSIGIYWDKSVEALKEFVDVGLVTHVSYTWRREFSYFYQCIADTKDLTTWAALLDSDEFLTFDNSYMKQSNPLVSLLNDYIEFAGVQIYWKFFPSNCYFLHPFKSLTFQNTHYCNNTIDNGQSKVIVQVKYVDRPINHGAIYNGDKYAVNLKNMTYPLNSTYNYFDFQVEWLLDKNRSWDIVVHSPLYLSHYWSRSFEDFVARTRRRNNYRTFGTDYILKEHYNCHGLQLDSNALLLAPIVNKLLNQFNRLLEQNIFIEDFNFDQINQITFFEKLFFGRQTIKTDERRWKYFFDKVMEKRDFIAEKYLERLTLSERENIRNSYHCTITAYMINYVNNETEEECDECWTMLYDNLIDSFLN